MEIIARCPKCGKDQALDANALDKRIRCPKCNKLFKLPKPHELSKAIDLLDQVDGTIYVDENGKIYG